MSEQFFTTFNLAKHSTEVLHNNWWVNFSVHFLWSDISTLWTEHSCSLLLGIMMAKHLWSPLCRAIQCDGNIPNVTDLSPLQHVSFRHHCDWLLSAVLLYGWERKRVQMKWERHWSLCAHYYEYAGNFCNLDTANVSGSGRTAVFKVAGKTPARWARLIQGQLICCDNTLLKSSEFVLYPTSSQPLFQPCWHPGDGVIPPSWA